MGLSFAASTDPTELPLQGAGRPRPPGVPGYRRTEDLPEGYQARTSSFSRNSGHDL